MPHCFDRTERGGHLAEVGAGGHQRSARDCSARAITSCPMMDPSLAAHRRLILRQFHCEAACKSQSSGTWTYGSMGSFATNIRTCDAYILHLVSDAPDL